MTRDEYLTELQRRIAKERGYTGLHHDFGALFGSLRDDDEGPTLVPRWPQDWADAGELVQEFDAGPGWAAGRYHRSALEGQPTHWFETHGASHEGYSTAETASRCWCAWKGVDLSDLPSVAP